MTDHLHITELEPDVDNEYTATLSLARRQAIAREMRSRELVEALKAAIAGLPHWRFEAQALLRAIAAGELPEPPTR